MAATGDQERRNWCGDAGRDAVSAALEGCSGCDGGHGTGRNGCGEDLRMGRVWWVGRCCRWVGLGLPNERSERPVRWGQATDHTRGQHAQGEPGWVMGCATGRCSRPG